MIFKNSDNIITEPEEEYNKCVSLKHRKTYAQFFTPLPIAQFMIKWLICNSNLNSILDPAFGLGIFARIIRDNKLDCKIVGYEIDKYIYEIAIKLFQKDNKIYIINKDYIFNDWNNKYDGIICNPPYFKFHDYDNRLALSEIDRNLSLKLNGFTNLYTLFLLKSIYQLKFNGRASYIVPSEFLNSDYGKSVKKYIIEHKSLRYVFIINFEENIFENILTTSSIFLFSNDNCSNNVEFINIKSLNDLFVYENEIMSYPNNHKFNSISFNELNPEIKWREYYQPVNSIKFKDLKSFSSFGKVVRGIATGSNKYFIFNLSKAKQYNITEKYLLPCISKSSDIKSPFFTINDFNLLKNKDKGVFLFNASNTSDFYVKKYLEKGILDEINKKYLTSHRYPWYSLEKRHPAPIWVSVFNRKGIRFIRNEANISNLTTFHCIYLNIFSNQKVDLLFAYLLTNISKEIFNDNRREYGNGLKKFEPNDINNANIVNLNKIDLFYEKEIMKLFYLYRRSELEKKPEKGLIDEINRIFVELFTI
jgi:adenine-specific DNA-methyltransferase